jgi:ribonuclease P protein component
LRFPKAARLALAAEFASVRASGRSVHGRLMLLGILKKDDASPARVGIVTSRKVGSAVVRNRVRRRLRELVRHARPAMNSGAWIVIVAKSASAKASHAALAGEWAILGKKAGIFRE